ncbi:P-loop containing nucleoside triphosphate hydrolase protein [Aspergillus terricola var. indicus]
MAIFRELLLITSWLWLHYSHDLLRAGNTKTILTKCANHCLVPELVKHAVELENWSLDGMVKWYCDAGKPIPAVERRQEPPDYLPQTQINLLLQGSPKLRALLPILQQQIYEYGEKSIIWTINPAEQFFIAAALLLCHIDYRVYHAELDTDERVALVNDFTTSPKSTMVLVCSFYVSSAGSNLQHLCRNVHLWDRPPSEPLKQQAIGRVARLGQTRTVIIYDYLVEESFNQMVIGKSLAKAIPDLLATLNNALFSINVERGEVDLGQWCRNKDGSILRIPDDETWSLVLDDARLEGKDLLKELLRQMDDSCRGGIRIDSDYALPCTKEEKELELASQSIDSQVFETGLLVELEKVMGGDTVTAGNLNTEASEEE